MLPASPLTYSRLAASYSIVISAVLTPSEGTLLKLTGTTTVSPASPDTDATSTLKAFGLNVTVGVGVFPVFVDVGVGVFAFVGVGASVFGASVTTAPLIGSTPHTKSPAIYAVTLSHAV